MISVIQLTDTHFSTPGNRSHGGFGYDTSAAYDAVLAHAFGSAADPVPNGVDLVVVTGDVADHGRPDEYEVAVDALSRLPVPTNVLPGNHDFDVPLKVSLPRPGLSMDRTQRIGPWLFVYADSNRGGRELDDTGRLVDRDDRIEANPRLGDRELAWMDDVIAGTDADNVFVWMHHPPGMPGSFGSGALTEEVTGLFERHGRIRGAAAGHIHSDPVLRVADRPVFVSAALTISFDFDRWTTLPPGYRSFRFGDDGSVESDSHLMDADEWPRIDLPEPVVRHFKGELSWDELMVEIAGLAGG